MANSINRFSQLKSKINFSLRVNYLYLFLILSSASLNSCVQENIVVKRRLLFAECHVGPKDTIIVKGDDTSILRKYFNLFYALNIEENGESTLIHRKNYNDTLMSSRIKISDSLVNHLFTLVNDDELLENKNAPHDSDFGGLYCGGNHLIVFTDSLGKERHIRFIPPLANEKLYHFDKLLWNIVYQPSIIGKSQIKPTAFDSLIFHKTSLDYKYENLPILKQVKFTPPAVVPDPQELENAPD